MSHTPQVKKVLVLLVLCLIPSVGASSQRPGFRHAQDGNRVTIAVQKAPEDLRPLQKRAMRYWNDLAGWKLLSFGEPSEISYQPFLEHPECGPCAAGIWGEDGYVHCQTYYPDQRVGTIAHELGHCLGFSHQPTGVMHHGKRLPSYDRELLRSLGYLVKPG